MDYDHFVNSEGSVPGGVWISLYGRTNPLVDYVVCLGPMVFWQTRANARHTGLENGRVYGLFILAQ